MVSFSCESCGDVLTKKKLDPHRNQCRGASYSCLDCMVHFQGTDYRAHTSCISEAQKYQGALYKEKKPKVLHQKNTSQQPSQALVPRTAFVEDAPDAETGAVAIINAPPRAPSPPPAAYSLGYQERAALPPVNVFDFMDTPETPGTSTLQQAPASRMLEGFQPPVYQENTTLKDVMQFQVQGSDHAPHGNGFSYTDGPIRQSNEAPSVREVKPNVNDSAYTTPAPKKHSRNKSGDKDLDTSSKKTTDRKRKRNSPAELDMSIVRAQREKDISMEDAPPLHSGLTGGLQRLMARPEFPPSPDYSGNASPSSPMKRAKPSTSKALIRAQREYEIQQEKERRAVAKAEIEREKERERGRERDRKQKESSKMKNKRREESPTSRTHREAARRRRDYSTSASPAPRDRKTIKAIEYRPESVSSINENGEMIVREKGEVGRVVDGVAARAELFTSLVTKGPDSERGMSINKALKRWHRERHDKYKRGLSKEDEEKDLWKSMRLKRNDRGEIVLFFAHPETQLVPLN